MWYTASHRPIKATGQPSTDRDLWNTETKSIFLALKLLMSGILSKWQKSNTDVIPYWNWPRLLKWKSEEASSKTDTGLPIEGKLTNMHWNKVLISWGCWKKNNHKPHGLNTTKIYFLIILEVRNPNLRCQSIMQWLQSTLQVRRVQQMPQPRPGRMNYNPGCFNHSADCPPARHLRMTKTS